MNTWKPITDSSSLPPIGSEESEHLDFKRDPWDKGDKGYNELARDVAQFANHLGGSLIVGADEDDEGRCTTYVNVPDPGALVSWIADVCHEALSPRAEVCAAVIKFDDLQVVVVNVTAHEGFVANKLKGTDRWEFKRRYGKNKRTLTFEEVERMWTDGRRGRILLDRIPGTEASNVQLDVIEGRGIMLSQTATLRKMDDFFIVSFGQAGSYNFPYEFVRAVWPASGGGWHVSLTVKFELNMMGEVRTYYESR